MVFIHISPVTCDICRGKSTVYISDIPEALEAYIGDDADKITVGSGKKVYWKCRYCRGKGLSSSGYRIRKQVNESYLYIPCTWDKWKK